MLRFALDVLCHSRPQTYCPSSETCFDYYAVPFVANSQLFAYRSSDFDNAPTTWQQVLDTSRKAEQEHRVGYASRIGPGNSIVTDFMPILWAYDPESFPEVQKPAVTLKSPQRAFQTLATLVGSRKPLGGASFDDFDVSAYLQQGCASMGIVWSARAKMLVQTQDSTERQMPPPGLGSTIATSNCAIGRTLTLPAQLDPDGVKGKAKREAASLRENLIFENVPQESGATSPPELGVWLLAKPAGSKQWNRALDFVAYATDLANDDDARKLTQCFAATNFGTPPPRKLVLDTLEKNAELASKHPSLIPAIRWSLENARARPRSACWREIECRLGTTLEQMIEQGTSGDDAIKRVTRGVSRRCSTRAAATNSSNTRMPITHASITLFS
jgi:ABC-type glycerol-3-phosphate transport system substrate-binding protein